MEKPTASAIQKAISLYKKGSLPWPERSIDWFIAWESQGLFPLKYIYALATDQRPASFNTNQAKAAMRHLGLAYVIIDPQENHTAAFEAAVAASLKDNAGRAARLAKASGAPSRTVVSQVVFRRNPDVVAAVLERAAGRCELCGGAAPFKKKSDGLPYLEVHHRKRLADGGKDTVGNALAACPNCHRKAHHG